MTDTPTTQASLLVRLGDAEDRFAWERFVDLYAPPVYACARRHGLQDADAADVTQDVLRAVHRAFRRGDYDPNRGRFRAWLITIVRNKLRDFATARNRRRANAAGLDNVPAVDGDPAAAFDQECERRLFAWAAEQVRGRFRPVTWQAFWRIGCGRGERQSGSRGIGINGRGSVLSEGPRDGGAAGAD